MLADVGGPLRRPFALARPRRPARRTGGGTSVSFAGQGPGMSPFRISPRGRARVAELDEGCGESDARYTAGAALAADRTAGGAVPDLPFSLGRPLLRSRVSRQPRSGRPGSLRTGLSSGNRGGADLPSRGVIRPHGLGAGPLVLQEGWTRHKVDSSGLCNARECFDRQRRRRTSEFGPAAAAAERVPFAGPRPARSPTQGRPSRRC